MRVKMTSKPYKEVDSTTKKIDEPNNDALSVDNLSTDKELTPKNDIKVKTKELNGPKGLEPTRYGDWESKGRCYDF